MLVPVKDHHRENTIADLMADRGTKLESFSSDGVTRVFSLLYGSVIRVSVAGNEVELHRVAGEALEVLRARHPKKF